MPDEDQAVATRRERIERLQAVGVLMDLCGLSVAQALAVRDRLSPAQMARLRKAEEMPIWNAAVLVARVVLDEVAAAAARPKSARRKRGRKTAGLRRPLVNKHAGRKPNL